MNVSEVIVGYLKAAGIGHVFGYPGDPNIEFMEAARRAGLQFVLGRREGTAGLMAEAYGFLTGRPGVCMSTLGPGSSNLVNAVANAYLDRVPMIALSGQIERKPGVCLATLGPGAVNMTLGVADAFLDHLRDLGLDHVGRGAEVIRLDRDDRGLDVRQLADREARGREQPEDHQHEADDRGEHRLLDRNLGELHCGAATPSAAEAARVREAPPSTTSTLAPSRSFCVPSVTTNSPGSSPAVTCTVPTWRCPVWTLRLDAVPSRTT